ncbi:hypothetical protein SD71_21495 [Cohnella kolymensis]|uniref:DUF4257 domain-containing protein n=1 Tax=Cohnella kolymensis TaxID=1590652 RepID=A0ABR5A0L2_9BACL|nr:hypothetical protein [Cohnella kolymensis]KIL34223.1 hypothetical protein SD71_21495 [Cohnella kolymensis]
MIEFAWLLLSIFLGSIGGYLNILLSNEGYLKPYKFKDKDGRERTSRGSQREIILGAAAGCISCVIAISTSEPTIWTIILYSLLAGISGGSYLNKLVERNTQARINEYNKQLDEAEEKISERGN